MSRSWQFFRFVYNRRPVILKGVNLWSFNWKPTGTDAYICLPGGLDPMPVPLYEIRVHGRSIFFAAYEVLPDYWIFSSEDDPFEAEGCPSEVIPDPPQRWDYGHMPECLQGHF